MTTLELVRGDRATLLVSGLLDQNSNPATFQTGDTLRWTAKRALGQPDSLAIIAKSSTGSGGITIAPGGATATVTITPSDWSTLPHLWKDLVYYWDLQLAIGGDAAKIVTLARGRGLIDADVTLADP